MHHSCLKTKWQFKMLAEILFASQKNNLYVLNDYVQNEGENYCEIISFDETTVVEAYTFWLKSKTLVFTENSI